MFREPAATVFKVMPHMNSRREEIRQQDDALGAVLDAPLARCLNSRLGQFQERRLDDGIPSTQAHLGDDPVQVGVGLVLPATVRDQQ
jgi:hypothetical protein